MSKSVAKRDEGLFTLGGPDWSKQRTEPLEVLCLGLCRTGTSCEIFAFTRQREYLKETNEIPNRKAMLEAMSILGYGTMYNSREAVRRHHLSALEHLLHAKHQGRPINIEQFESLWGEYRAISGDVVYIFAQECIELYPNAKVVLTVRDDEEKWLQSLLKTMWAGRISWLTRFIQIVDPVWASHRQFKDPYWKYLFWDDVPNQGLRVYREHNALVERMAAGRVLVYNTKDGWPALCEFLGKDIPSETFPHVNKQDEYHNVFWQGEKQALIEFGRKAVIGAVLPSLILGLCWWERFRISNFVGSMRR